MLTERRAIHNYGLEGGQPGKVGLNLLKKHDGRIISLGGKTAIDVEAGDVFSMLTPGKTANSNFQTKKLIFTVLGGAGYGIKTETSVNAEEDKEKTFYEKGSLFAYRMLQESV